ncbi:MAG: hypothetical protein KC493_03935 [Bacteriovoracaceae bacterium]|nr:hypothetical protein [Bacteriovoracaceae bacterium]
MRILYLPLILLISFSCANHTNLAVKRELTSLGTGECRELIRDFIEGEKYSTLSTFKTKVLKPTIVKLSNVTTQSKLKFLNLLNARRGGNKTLSDMYAKTLNQMLNKNLITRESIPELLTSKTNSKYILDFSYGEVKVIPRAFEGLPNLDQSMDIIINRMSPNSHDVIKLREVLSLMDYSPIEFNQFQKYFNQFPKDDADWDYLKEYLLFAQAMRSKHQLRALEEMPKLFYPNDKGKYINKFRNIRKDISKYETKQIVKQEKKALKKGMSGQEAKAFAKREAKRQSEVYGSLKYACRSAKPTAQSKQAAKQTSKFFMGMGITATAGTYAYANWDKDKTEFDWYGKLGHDLAWKFIFQYGYNAIMTDQAATMLKKTLSLHLFYTPADAIEAGMYEWEFGEEDSFLDEEYNRIVKLRSDNDPEFVKAYNDAMSTLNKEYFPEKFKRFMGSLLNGDIKDDKNEFDEILSLNDVTNEELKDSDLKEKLFEAISLKLYEENSGRVKSGSHFLDRYLFVRSYDMLDVPKSLFVGLWIYRTMCMGGLNMKSALTQASIIYTIDQIVGKFIYYKIRRDIINM